MHNMSTQGGSINFVIKVGSNQIDNSYPVVAIKIDKTLNKIPYAKLTLHDGSPMQDAFVVSNNNVFEIGSPITIQLGYQPTLETVFQGIIVKQTIQSNRHTVPYLVIDCRDAAYRTTLVPKNKTFANLCDSDILAKIISTYSDLAKDIASTTIQHEILAQQETTDWDFLNIRAEANGQVILVDDGKITSQKPQVSQSPTLTLDYDTHVYALHLEMDARDQWQGASGTIWDPNRQDNQVMQAKDPGEQSFGKTEYTQLTRINQQNPMMFYHSGTLAENEMASLATSLLSLNRFAKIRGKVSIQGIAAIKPGNSIKLDKGATNFQGLAYVSGVVHKIEAGNWITQLTIGLPNQRYMRKYPDIVGLPTAGMLAPIHGLQIGIVQQLTDDPKSAYRIFVRFPMVHNSDEGSWCRVGSWYASKGAGAFFMPEIGDEVVVGFINDDLRSPVIVGSLYSSKHAPPVGLDEKNSQKTFLSASQLALTFNDQDQVITLKTPGKRTIVISDKDHTIEIINGDAHKIILGHNQVEIVSQQDITLKAQGNIQLIAGKNIVLKASNEVNISGMNVATKADMKASLVGATSAEVQSNVTTIIKGSIVQIN